MIEPKTHTIEQPGASRESAGALERATCPNRLFKLRHYLCDNAESDSIPTLFREVSDVGLGYTP